MQSYQMVFRGQIWPKNEHDQLRFSNRDDRGRNPDSVNGVLWWQNVTVATRLCAQLPGVSEGESCQRHLHCILFPLHTHSSDGVLIWSVRCKKPRTATSMCWRQRVLDALAWGSSIPEKSAESGHRFLLGLVCRYCARRVCIHDQGREFNNCLVKDIFQQMKIDVAMKSAYHLQTNG